MMKKESAPIYPSQVTALCREVCNKLTNVFGEGLEWDNLSEREQTLISVIANSVVQHILRGGPIPSLEEKESNL